MNRLFWLMWLASVAIAQTPAAPLSKVTIKTVTCEIVETTPRDGIAYTCTQSIGDGPALPVARGTLIPVSASVTTTVTVQTASAIAGNPPDQSTFAITANRLGTGASGGVGISWSVSTNGFIQP